MALRDTDIPLPELARRAGALLQAGSVDTAIAAYSALVDRAPNLADAWYNLGYLQRRSRDFEGALASYAAALAQRVGAPEAVHVNRAVILSEHLGRDEAAAHELDCAIAANAVFLPAWLNLGLLHEDRGDRHAARAAYLQARSIDPAHGRADARLAAIDIADGNAADAVVTLTARLADPALSTEGAAEIGFMLGNARDDQGNYNAAFDAYTAANRTALSLIPPSLRYDREAHDRRIGALIRAFPVDSAHVTATTSPSPVFICGMFRSGSTLCERLLARHSRVTAGGELETIGALAEKRLKPYPTGLTGLSASAIDALRDEACGEYRARFPHADMLTDKHCANFLHIGLIKTMFPDARIVHTRRNAIDNILSIFFLYFDDSISYGFALDDAVHYYKGYRRLMDHWRAVYGESILDFDYDAVVREPAPSMGALLDFCGLDPEPQCLAGRAAEGVVRTASAWQVRAPLHQRSSGRWRHYTRHIPHIVEALDGY